MSIADYVVAAGSPAAIGVLAWFFFAPREALSAEASEGVSKRCGVWASAR